MPIVSLRDSLMTTFGAGGGCLRLQNDRRRIRRMHRYTSQEGKQAFFGSVKKTFFLLIYYAIRYLDVCIKIKNILNIKLKLGMACVVM